MAKIFFQINGDSIPVADNMVSTGWTDSIFFWIAIIEFFLILFLIWKLNGKKRPSHFSDVPKDKLKKAKKTEINMANLMDSINGSRELYVELSRVCHPDRFINTDKQEIASEIFKEISKNKRNYEKLLALKEKAITELNVTFNQK
jgi:hypothetical protein